MAVLATGPGSKASRGWTGLGLGAGGCGRAQHPTWFTTAPSQSSVAAQILWP